MASRTELAAAAVVRYVALNPVIVPDLGNVRDEVILLLRKLTDRAAPALIRLMLQMSEDVADARSNFAGLRSQVGESGLIEEILKRGVERGEIDSAHITPRIASLPTDLARHEAMMTFESLPNPVIREIKHDIFLPLVSPARR